MKAYDVKVLLEKLKLRGVDIAEESARALVEELFVWLKDSAIESETKYDDLLLAVYPKIEEYILENVDKISPNV